MSGWGFSTLSRVCGAFPAVSPADEAVDFVDGTSVAVGDDSHDFAPVAGSGGVFHQLVVDAGEKLEILGVIDEDLTGFADGPGEVLAVGVVERGLVDAIEEGDEVEQHQEGNEAASDFANRALFEEAGSRRCGIAHTVSP